MNGIILFFICVIVTFFLICIVSDFLYPEKNKNDLLHDVNNMYFNSSLVGETTHSNLENIIFFDIPKSSKFSIDYSFSKENTKSMIILHGYNDYNYNNELHDKLKQNGYNIYCITLRNYGQNIKNKNNYFFVESIDGKSQPSLLSYFYEINTTIDFIDYIDQKNNKNTEINFTSHSLGGLLTTLYINEGKYKTRIKKIILNSPFFTLNGFNDDFLTKHFHQFSEIFFVFFRMFNDHFQINKTDIPILDETNNIYINSNNSKTIITNGFEINPVIKIKKTNNLPWMLNKAPIYLGLGNAVVKQLNRINQNTKNSGYENIDLKNSNVKVLLLTTESDTILNSKEIYKSSTLVFGDNFEHVDINGGYHNVFSSSENIRKQFYDAYFNFLNNNI
jgi:alpha-beta hydrolase superfamily lysophospholipase